jgi:hypothetical protein
MRGWQDDLVVMRTSAFLVLRRILGVVGGGRTPDAKEVEIAVLRRQLAVLRRQPYRVVSPLSSAANTSTYPSASSWYWAPLLPTKASRMPRSTTRSAGWRERPTRRIQPVMATPPRTAMVMAASAMPLLQTPASGQAEATGRP